MTSTLDPTLPRYQEMARQIIERIDRQELRPGDRLPSFVEMRQQYGTTQNTVERVYTKLEKEGYIRREAKRGVFVAEPRAISQSVIRVVTQSGLLHNEYYMRLLTGIQGEAHLRGAEIVLCQEETPIDWKRTDGIALMGPSNRAERMIRNMPVGFSCISLMTPSIAGFPLATVDEVDGIERSIEYLVGLGHRRIGYLTLEKKKFEFAPWRFRFNAYEMALAKAGIEPDPRWSLALRESAYEEFRGFVDLGREKMEAWLRDGWRDLGITAVLAQNDETAIGVMQALEDAGIKVPDDISVMGFDGIGVGTCIRPCLTTIAVPLEEIGAAAIASLLETGESRPAAVTLPPALVERASTTWAPGVARTRESNGERNIGSAATASL